MAGDGVKLLFDSKSGRTRDIPRVPFFGFGEVFKFTESLVSVEGSRRVEWTAPTSLHSDVEMDK